MFLPVATSSSNSSNFSSICMSSSAASGFWPSFPRCKAVSEKMHDLVSSVQELFEGVVVGVRGGGGRGDKDQGYEKSRTLEQIWEWPDSPWQDTHSSRCHTRPRKLTLTPSAHLKLYISPGTCVWQWEHPVLSLKRYCNGLMFSQGGLRKNVWKRSHRPPAYIMAR